MQAALFSTLTQQRAGAPSLDDCGKAIAHRHATGHSSDAMRLAQRRVEYEAQALRRRLPQTMQALMPWKLTGARQRLTAESPLSAGLKDLTWKDDSAVDPLTVVAQRQYPRRVGTSYSFTIRLHMPQKGGAFARVVQAAPTRIACSRRPWVPRAWRGSFRR